MTRVLCLHGLGGTGATMWPLVARLCRAGHTVLAPTLPGHGGRPEDLLDVAWAQWLAAVQEWPADVLVGQSLGGSLALAIAALGGCRAVAAINPVPPDPDAAASLEWRRSRGQQWIDAATFPGECAYDRVPLHALEELANGVAEIDLLAVHQPVLLIFSAADDVADPTGADRIAEGLGRRPHRLVLRRGGHVATLDVDRARLATAVIAFIASCAVD